MERAFVFHDCVSDIVGMIAVTGAALRQAQDRASSRNHALL
jgi:hypothetical protein